MSIISDALKKAQNLRTENIVVDDTFGKQHSASPPAPARTRKGPLIGILALLVFSGIVFGFIARIVIPNSQTTAPAAGKDAIPPLIPASDKAASPVRIAAEAIVSKLPNITGTLPPSKKQKPAGMPAPDLNGIMYSPTKPQAIVNGEMVSEGETASGWTVEKIFRDHVLLSSGEEETELKLR